MPTVDASETQTAAQPPVAQGRRATARLQGGGLSPDRIRAAGPARAPQRLFRDCPASLSVAHAAQTALLRSLLSGSGHATRNPGAAGQESEPVSVVHDHVAPTRRPKAARVAPGSEGGPGTRSGYPGRGSPGAAGSGRGAPVNYPPTPRPRVQATRGALEAVLIRRPRSERAAGHLAHARRRLDHLRAMFPDDVDVEFVDLPLALREGRDAQVRARADMRVQERHKNTASFAYLVVTAEFHPRRLHDAQRRLDAHPHDRDSRPLTDRDGELHPLVPGP